MSACNHHWTVTSECPKCLRQDLELVKKRVEDLSAELKHENERFVEEAAGRYQCSEEMRVLIDMLHAEEAQSIVDELSKAETDGYKDWKVRHALAQRICRLQSQVKAKELS